METLIIIGIICVIIYFIYKKSNDSSSSQPLNDGVKAEIDEALEQIFLFRNDNEFWKEETGLLMLLPINQNGNLYAQDSQYIKIQLLLHSSPDDWFFSYIKPKYLSNFEIALKDGSADVIKKTIVPYYNMNYNKAMSQLCEYLKSRYPEHNWQYDNGRIMANLKK